MKKVKFEDLSNHNGELMVVKSYDSGVMFAGECHVIAPSDHYIKIHNGIEYIGVFGPLHEKDTIYITSS